MTGGVLRVAGIARVIRVIATVVPSRSAAALRPVNGLRYDGSPSHAAASASVRAFSGTFSRKLAW